MCEQTLKNVAHPQRKSCREPTLTHCSGRRRPSRARCRTDLTSFEFSGIFQNFRSFLHLDVDHRLPLYSDL